MRGRFHFSCAFSPRGVAQQLLVVSVPCGVLCGMVCFFYNETELAPLFSGLLSASAEISDFLLAILFPFLFSVISLSAGYPSFLLLICFGKAFLFGFLCFGLCISLKLSPFMCCMAFSGSCVSLVLLYGFCRQYFATKELPSPLKVLSFFLVVACLSLFFYYRFIPAVAGLLFL